MILLLLLLVVVVPDILAMRLVFALMGRIHLN
jgi:hypothetical protein